VAHSPDSDDAEAEGLTRHSRTLASCEPDATKMSSGAALRVTCAHVHTPLGTCRLATNGDHRAAPTYASMPAHEMSSERTQSMWPASVRTGRSATSLAPLPLAPVTVNRCTRVSTPPAATSSPPLLHDHERWQPGRGATRTHSNTPAGPKLND
jgi:hypothetical protein